MLYLYTYIYIYVILYYLYKNLSHWHVETNHIAGNSYIMSDWMANIIAALSFSFLSRAQWYEIG